MEKWYAAEDTIIPSQLVGRWKLDGSSFLVLLLARRLEDDEAVLEAVVLGLLAGGFLEGGKIVVGQVVDLLKQDALVVVQRHPFDVLKLDRGHDQVLAEDVLGGVHHLRKLHEEVPERFLLGSMATGHADPGAHLVPDLVLDIGLHQTIGEQLVADVLQAALLIIFLLGLDVGIERRNQGTGLPGGQGESLINDDEIGNLLLVGLGFVGPDLEREHCLFSLEKVK